MRSIPLLLFHRKFEKRPFCRALIYKGFKLLSVQSTIMFVGEQYLIIESND